MPIKQFMCLHNDSFFLFRVQDESNSFLTQIIYVYSITPLEFTIIEKIKLHNITCRNCFAGKQSRNEGKEEGGTEKEAVPTRTSNVCSHIFFRCCHLPMELRMQCSVIKRKLVAVALLARIQR